MLPADYFELRDIFSFERHFALFSGILLGSHVQGHHSWLREGVTRRQAYLRMRLNEADTPQPMPLPRPSSALGVPYREIGPSVSVIFYRAHPVLRGVLSLAAPRSHQAPNGGATWTSICITPCHIHAETETDSRATRSLERGGTRGNVDQREERRGASESTTRLVADPASWVANTPQYAWGSCADILGVPAAS